ncbi:MAG: riboflavin synthase [Alphaproteobacteria bacterium]
MFTGLISDEGEIIRITGEAERHITLAPMQRNFSHALGDSIAVNGICLTVAAMTATDFSVTLSPETLRVTTAKDWQTGERVNLEPALRVGDALGGHLVSGHVDGVGQVRRITPVGESSVWEFSYPLTLAPYLAPKGSVTIDGVSLTVNEVSGAKLHTLSPETRNPEPEPFFTVTIIPHTAKVTGFARLKPGDRVNLEADMLARYVARQLELRA